MVVAACLLLAGCGKQPDKNTSASENEPPDSEPAKPAVRVKMDLALVADVSLRIPQGTVSKVPAGLWDPSAADFDPPVHPLGTVESLKLNGKDIPLASKELKDGLLTTVGFGEIEVFLKGIRGGDADLEYRAFPDEIEKLKKAYPADGTK